MAAVFFPESAPIPVTEEDLRRAWRSVRLTNTTFEKSMASPAIAITIRRIAECEIRRRLRLAELQLRDRKRAQANDLTD